jgi:hypothetical protein
MKSRVILLVVDFVVADVCCCWRANKEFYWNLLCVVALLIANGSLKISAWNIGVCENVYFYTQLGMYNEGHN